MKRKFLSIFAALAVAVSLAGCQSQEPAAEEVVEMKVVEASESDWTHEQVSGVTYLCGKPFSLPCSLEDLPDDFEIGEPRYRDKDTVLKTYITIDGQDSGYYDSLILLNGEHVGIVYYYESGNDNIVFGIEFYPFESEGKDFVINGINQNSSFEDVKKALGNSMVRDENITAIHDYRISNSEYPEEVIRIISFDEDEVIAIAHVLLIMKKD